MSEIANQLPADIETLHALVAAAWTQRDAEIAERDTAIGERDRALSQIDRLCHLLRQLSRTQFGRRSEKLDPDQMLLALELNALHTSRIQDMVHLDGNRSRTAAGAARRS